MRPRPLKNLLAATLTVVCLTSCGQDAKPSAAPQDNKPPSYWAQRTTDPDDKVRREAFQRLAALGPEAADAIPAMMGLLGHPEAKVRRSAAQVLGKIGKPAVPRLITEVEHGTNATRMAGSAQALGFIGVDAEDALPALLTALDASNAQVRAGAAEGIGRIGGAFTDKILASSITVADPAMADLARAVLGSDEDDKQGGVSASVRTKYKETDANTAAVLGQFGIPEELAATQQSSEVVVAFSSHAKDAPDLTPHIKGLLYILEEDPELAPRVAAARALGLIRDPRALPRYREYLNDHEDVVVEVVRGLANYGPNAVGVRRRLLEMRKHGSDKVRLAVEEALARLEAGQKP